jgi:hypothetical protein
VAKLKINRGTTYNRTGTYSVDGVATSLVGATIRFTMKTAEYDSDTSDATASVSKNITDGTAGGEYTIALAPSDTATLDPGKYFYDTKVQNADGTVYKLDEGTITLDASPTNRLS